MVFLLGAIINIAITHLLRYPHSFLLRQRNFLKVFLSEDVVR